MNLYEKALELIKKKDLTHFSKKAAIKILEEFPGEPKYILEAGFTPSGKVHLGNFGDILITESVRKILGLWGYEAETILAIDSQDPFRKPPIFLPDEFKRNVDQYLGRPLDTLPDPWGCHENYVEHFVDPLIEALPQFDLHPRIIFAHEIHTDERYIELLKQIILNRDKVAEIFNEIHASAGHAKRYGSDWIPFRPRCARCGRADEKVKPLEVLDDGYRIKYKCEACGHEGIADIRKAEGKAPWRVDWPLRWMLFNVHFEPMGKDLMAAGSSYHTGRALLEKFFGRKAPIAIFYDFFYWVEPGKEPQKFSKRAGIGLGAHEWLRYAEPEALNYMLLKRHLGDIEKDSLRHIDFNPRDIPIYVSRYDMDEAQILEKLKKEKLSSEDAKTLVAYFLAQTNTKKAFNKPIRRVPYDQAIKVALWMESIEEGLNMLRRIGALPKDARKDEIENAKRRLLFAKNFINDWWEPPRIDLEKIVNRLKENIRYAIKYVLSDLLSYKEISQDIVRTKVREAANKYGVSPREIYKSLYILALGEDTGPQAYRIFRKEFTRKNLENALKCL